MCGIAGLVRSASLAPGDPSAVGRILEAEVHRGPDGHGLYQGPDVVLGHRRLSIIDLSDAGLQPMANEDGSLRVTFNGEIYNYRELRGELASYGHTFRSQTDTEVLLHGYEQWGMEGLVGRLRGMFAFALYDVHRGLLLARDRLGIKPLYYHSTPELLVFASEVKALMESGVIPAGRDRRALTGFLMAGAVPQPLTIEKAVRCLPAGHWAEWTHAGPGKGEFRLHGYWDLTHPAASDHGSSASIQASLAPLVEDLVRRHLISDVPVGVFLSGGVDSAGLVALASRIRRQEGHRLETLTVVFDERQFSEASPAAEIARHFGTKHREVRVREADFRRELPAFFASMDQPTNDGVNSYFVSRAAREAGLKVVLSGLGGDEVFWGYKHYRWLRSGSWLAGCPAPLRYLGAEAGYQYGRLRGRDNWMRMAWLKPAASNARVYLTMRGFFAPDQIARLMDLTQAELDDAVEEHFGSLVGPGDFTAESVNYIEMKRYLHDQLLRDTDVFSMAHSIEARVPWLDHVLVERLWQVAGERKLDPAVNKPLLVGAIGDPAVSLAGARPKQGFTFPMAHWMKACAPELREMASTTSLEPKAVDACWTDFSEGRMHWSRAWALTVLGAAHAS
jgi:asparagine synthase (glutamine-hydrolysing)